MRAVLPEVRKWLALPAEATYPAVERRGEPRVAPMPAD
jgi:hypothetical protein